MELWFKKILTKFLKWKYKHISNNQFVNIVSGIIGLMAGLAAVTIKNITHFIQELLEGEFKDNILFTTDEKRISGFDLYPLPTSNVDEEREPFELLIDIEKN